MLSLQLSAHANSKSSEDHFVEAELPLSAEQPDLLRTGLQGPLTHQVRLAPSFQETHQEKVLDIARNYGMGAALRRQADLKVVGQYHRLPGLKSSFLGVEIETGEDLELNPGDWLGDVDDSPRLQCDLHATMQKHLGME